MKQVIILLVISFLVSCNNEHKPVAPKEPPPPAEAVFNCFNGPDTIVSKDDSKGCHNSFYRRIDGESVLKIEYKGVIQYDSCIRVNIDTLRDKSMAQLLLYDDRNVDFIYFCNDYGHGPSRSVNATAGTLYLRFYPADKAGDNSPHDFKISILARDVEFWDSTRSKKFVLDNILYYKVPNWTWYAG